MSTLDDFAGNVEMRVSLREPFPRHLVSQIPKGSHVEDYVNHAAVTDRLNAAAPGWTISKPDFIIDQDGHISGVLCSMTIGSVTRWEIGDVDQKSKPGAEAKIAMSDFIKRAAMRFGVGIDLWSKEDLHKASPVTPSSPPSPIGDGATVGAVEDSGHDIGEGVTPEPETAPALPQMGQPEYAQPSKLASDQQWENLLKVTGGSMQKAVNKINAANKTNYTAATARAGATWDELVAAIV